MENRPAFTKAFGATFQHKLEETYARLTSKDNNFSQASLAEYQTNRGDGFGFNPFPALEIVNYAYLSAGRQVNRFAVAGLELLRTTPEARAEHGL